MVAPELPYAFRAMTLADLPLVGRWLHTPEVVRWWGDPGEQYGLIAGDLTVPEMAQWIVSHEGRPFAYVQACRVSFWPQPHFAHLPEGTIAIDPFIGEPDMLGCGHGSRFLKILAERLRAEGAPAVVIDPDVDNLRARRAYRRAGFRGDTIVDTDEGPAVVMTFVGDNTMEASG
jgi:aminoglycoside 6'-N-acetyltransferase